MKYYKAQIIASLIAITMAFSTVITVEASELPEQASVSDNSLIDVEIPDEDEAETPDEVSEIESDDSDNSVSGNDIDSSAEGPSDAEEINDSIVTSPNDGEEKPDDTETPSENETEDDDKIDHPPGCGDGCVYVPPMPEQPQPPTIAQTPQSTAAESHSSSEENQTSVIPLSDSDNQANTISISGLDNPPQIVTTITKKSTTHPLTVTKMTGPEANQTSSVSQDKVSKAQVISINQDKEAEVILAKASSKQIKRSSPATASVSTTEPEVQYFDKTTGLLIYFLLAIFDVVVLLCFIY